MSCLLEDVGPHLAHGTFVASRVVYGDDITVILTRRATPWCPAGHRRPGYR